MPRSNNRALGQIPFRETLPADVFKVSSGPPPFIRPFSSSLSTFPWMAIGSSETTLPPLVRAAIFNRADFGRYTTTLPPEVERRQSADGCEVILA